MAVLKCKLCGGDMEVSADKTFGTCEYCGSTMTLPKIDSEQRSAIFNRGNHFRRSGEFDKALAVYERIVAEDDTDAEAHWCCALCRFGIEYVEDPATFEWLPTCHRASFDSFLEDVDYLAAVENSVGITKRQYQKDAAKIAEVQRGILATSQNTEPYDVFISYKELDSNGNRTRDSILAQDIYYQLTEQDRRVFFSRITLEDVPGTQYEPYIFAALNSAKVMIVVGTSAENLNAVWVKNEWSRYLSMMRKDRSKLLLPCYRDMDPYDLPEQLSVLMSYDMGKIGFIQDLIRGVNKVLDANKKPESAPVRETVVVQQSGTNVNALLKRGYMALEDGEFNKADEFFEEVLNQNAESAEAYLGKLLAAKRCADLEQYADRLTAKYDSVSYEKLTACGEASEHIEKTVSENAITGYLKAENIRQLYVFDRTYRSALTCRKNQKKQLLVELNSERLLARAKQYAEGETKKKYDAFINRVTAVLDKRIDVAYKLDESSVEKVKTAYAAHIAQADRKAAELRVDAENRRENDYLKYVSVFEKATGIGAYEKARIDLISMNGYKDSAELAEKCGMRIAEIQEERRIAEEKAAEALKIAEEKAAKKQAKIIMIVAVAVTVCIALFLVVTEVIIPNNKYNAAVALMEQGKYEDAITAFETLDKYYRDSNERIIACQIASNDNAYNAAVALMNEGKFEEAILAFTGLPGYRDSNEQIKICRDTITEQKYVDAVALMNDGEIIKGYELLNEIIDYKDSAEIVSQYTEQYYKELLKNPEVGSTVYFGAYEQDNDTSNGKESIEWIVLAKEDGKLLVISKYALDSLQYNSSSISGINWADCDLRTWLNNRFVNSAFLPTEQAMIVTAKVSADKNPQYSTSPGKATTDKVFLLSIAEVEKYFATDESRMCIPTAYAVAQGAHTNSDYTTGSGENACWWWLRSPGTNQYCAAGVFFDGSIYYMGYRIVSNDGAVRPAMWIDLSM